MVYEIETIIDSNTIVNLYDKDTEMAINSRNVKLINNHNEFSFTFVCFNYAFKEFDGYLNYCEQAYEELEDFYSPIGISKAIKGDIISYHEISDFNSKYERPCKENCLHFAVIEKTNGTLKGTIIKSKWGRDGVFKTDLFNVPSTYGNVIKIWRKNKTGEIK